MSGLVNKFKEFWGGAPEEQFEDGFDHLFQVNTNSSAAVDVNAASQMNFNYDESSAPQKDSSHLKVIDDYSVTNEVIVMEPENFNQAVDIIKYLKKGASIVLNLSKLDTSVDSQRLLDFVCGGVYALDGSQKRVGEGVFLLAPNSVNINACKENKIEQETTSTFWNEDLL